MALMGHLLGVDPHVLVDLFEDQQSRVFRLPKTCKQRSMNALVAVETRIRSSWIQFHYSNPLKIKRLK